MTKFHTPVLLEQAIDALLVSPGKMYIDCTFGGGGHTQAISAQGGQVLALDQDQQALDYFSKHNPVTPNITLIKANFLNLTEIANRHQFNQVDGILFDLGVSSWQLDQAERGFSFSQNAPLDMRMDRCSQVTAADLLAALGAKELKKLFQIYADEPLAKPIAESIIFTRKNQPITTTLQLAHLTERVYRHHHHRPLRHHPATKIFQALRIAVNDELRTLEHTLPQTIPLLKTGGRLVVISFHSGEDRIVKQFIKSHPREVTNLTPKPVTPTQIQINTNPRARSSRLRVAQKNHEETPAHHQPFYSRFSGGV